VQIREIRDQSSTLSCRKVLRVLLVIFPLQSSLPKFVQIREIRDQSSTLSCSKALRALRVLRGKTHSQAQCLKLFTIPLRSISVANAPDSALAVC